ncbi:AAA family ATPase [Gorillibacterium massiliense]|uniref:AAA family ATPase n=1 Tax=Gorillibacterium massiliense TaxID=1280390 RepID=UPI0004BADC9B|nr:AAA family ATPase [Gorillibacterium massiliense]
MIIWINGSFGAGKTTTAFDLHHRLPGSYVFDPENIGYFFRKNIPRELQFQDFQDFPIWRSFNYELLSYIAGKSDRVILIPMTVVNPDYFQEIVGRLREEGHTVHHVALWVSKKELTKRLGRRLDRHSWASKQVDRCMEGLSSHTCFQPHIETDGLSIDEVVTRVAAVTGIELQPDTRSPWKKTFNRINALLQHIRS